ncbi:helix-turn-helix domain-containing protein [Nonomuraea fuscirosea]|uniref:winged helix-turn-helix transcriptional regulator n=1 Tax=Nonomuraea fuscirosea TaxID=1291556 RepID=UPI0034185837
MAKTLGKESTCSIARSLEAVGDTWTLLIIREAMLTGATRFQEFREALGVAPNILSKRLEKIVEDGLMERRTYREPGSRPRDEYVLTESGRALTLVIGALADWGRVYRPRQDGTSPCFAGEKTGGIARLGFVTADGDFAQPAELVAQRTPDAQLTTP